MYMLFEIGVSLKEYTAWVTNDDRPLWRMLGDAQLSKQCRLVWVDTIMGQVTLEVLAPLAA